MSYRRVYIRGFDLVAGAAASAAACAEAGAQGISYQVRQSVASLSRGISRGIGRGGSEDKGKGENTLPLFPLHKAANDQLEDWLEKRPSFRRYLQNHDRLVKLGSFAARNLVPQRGGTEQSLGGADGFRQGDMGVIAGSSRGVSEYLLTSYKRHLADRPLSPRVSPITTGSALAAAVAQAYQLQGMTSGISAACSSGLQALGIAASLIRDEVMPSALVVAAESCLDNFTLSALVSAGVHSRASQYQPFGLPLKPCDDDGRNPAKAGLALAEGAAALILSATPPTDGSKVIELVGFASCRETSTMTGITEDAEGLQRAIHLCLAHANSAAPSLQLTPQLTPQSIDLIIGHGAGTRRGDAAEFACYQKVFGKSLPPIQQYKWLMGHSLGATGLQALALGLTCWQNREFWPAPYPLAYPFQQLPKQSPQYILCCSLGFGGICTAALLKCSPH